MKAAPAYGERALRMRGAGIDKNTISQMNKTNFMSRVSFG